MYFTDRYDAAAQLLPLLLHYKKAKGVILAVPRGGVPIGYYLSNALELPLDLLMTKKLGHPANPEFAIGAVSMEDSLVEETRDLPEDYISDEILRIRAQLKERYKKFMGHTQPAPVKGKIVIVVDDGIATGRTILSTIRLLRRGEPEKIVVAVPVASAEAARRISREVDEFICPHIPPDFFGVGNFYDDFSQVEDGEVIHLLKELEKEGRLLPNHV
ncbi:MAG: phosphoribosyltransferase [Sphingobacteriales bacterium]|nr:phosphoribosyltransferase [Sphingobacteriales bacterium]